MWFCIGLFLVVLGWWDMNKNDGTSKNLNELKKPEWMKYHFSPLEEDETSNWI
mgnify:CR=1